MRAIVGADAVAPGDERVGRALVPHEWGRWPACVVQPGTAAEVAEIVRAVEDAGVAIVPCGSGSRLLTGYPPSEKRAYVVVRMARMNRVIDYQPDDLTVTCEPGITLHEIQQALAARRQFLALDCPLAERTTLGGIVSSNSAGFSRPSYGTPRDLLIGVKAVMTGGVEVKGGGRVVKNVAGYDVCKLFTGAWGTLGILTELTFKVQPMNEAELVIAWQMPAVSAAAKLGLELARSETAPAYMLATNEPEGRIALVAGLQGVAARVLWQQEALAKQVRQRGIDALPLPLGEPETAYLRDVQARLHRDVRLSARITCLPTELPSVVSNLELLPGLRMTAQCAVGTLNVASPNPDHALTLSLRSAAPVGSHLLWTRIDPALARPQKLALWGEDRVGIALHRTLKQSLDPKGTFSPGRFLDGI
ncbi:MAG TPA: FAD-binding oxidoreductase [Chthonomonadaceae bacterium]|nr:FAD-binding oxidoreductase [Chthonomonadaceae bacterium]